jgi:hypothetical protein
MLVDITSNTLYKSTATFRTQIYSKCLRIKLNGYRPLQTLVDITSNTFYKCTATFRTQSYRKCLRIKLNGFRPVQTLMDITSNSFYKCTATFRTHSISINIPRSFPNPQFSISPWSWQQRSFCWNITRNRKPEIAIRLTVTVLLQNPSFVVALNLSLLYFYFRFLLQGRWLPIVFSVL